MDGVDMPSIQADQVPGIFQAGPKKYMFSPEAWDYFSHPKKWNNSRKLQSNFTILSPYFVEC